MDSDTTASPLFAGITRSDDDNEDNDADSSFEVVEQQDQRTTETYMSQLGTPPKLSDDIDESLRSFLKRSESKEDNDGTERVQDSSFLGDPGGDNEDESIGSSAASTAADIMRDMLNDLPRSNDTLGTEISLVLDFTRDF